MLYCPNNSRLLGLLLRLEVLVCSESEDTAKEAVEYVVVQKSMKQGVEVDWMLWGMTEETAASSLTALQPKSGSGKLPVSGAQG